MFLWYTVGFVTAFIITIVAIVIGIPKLGVLKIDMSSREDKDIARFIFSMPLEEAVKHKMLWIKIESSDHLSSIE